MTETAGVGNIFIMASGHSGSTLLNMILGSHSNAVAVGEVTHLPKNLALDTFCSCGARMSECSFWSAVVERMGERLHCDVRTNPYALNLGFINATQVVDRRVMTSRYRNLWRFRSALAFFHLWAGRSLPGPLLSKFAEGNASTLILYDAVREASGVGFVIDASKSYLKGAGIYRMSAGRTKIVLLSRDGRACFYSRMKRGGVPEEALRVWKNYYERALPLVERCVDSKDMVRVKYEDLVSDPATEIARICNLLEMPMELGMLDFRAKVHHVTNGNRMAFGGKSEIRSDAAWQRELGEKELAYFEAHAGQLNRSLGY